MFCPFLFQLLLSYVLVSSLQCAVRVRRQILSGTIGIAVVDPFLAMNDDAVTLTADLGRAIVWQPGRVDDGVIGPSGKPLLVATKRIAIHPDMLCPGTVTRLTGNAKLNDLSRRSRPGRIVGFGREIWTCGVALDTLITPPAEISL